MNRPIIPIAIGYIMGIIWGIYLKNSIAPIYFILILIYAILKKKNTQKQEFKLISIKRYNRYVKIFIKPITMTLIIISSIISNTIVLYQMFQYENLYKTPENIKIIATVVSSVDKKEYYNQYKIKVKNRYVYLKTKEKLEYGDKIELIGEYEEPSGQRNYRGFNYKQYLRTLKIYGTIKASSIEILEKNCENKIFTFANKIQEKIKQNIDITYKEEVSKLILGIMLGDTKNLETDIKEDFSKSSISHILAVSGMHVSYIIYISTILLKKLLGKKQTRIIVSVILIIYMFITDFSVSVMRASISGILMLISFAFYRKSDTWNNMAISMLIILIKNPFNIQNISLILSYGGAIGIIVFQKYMKQLVKLDKTPMIKEVLTITISAQIILTPIIIITFKKVGIAFLITNILISPIISIIVMGGFIQIIFSFISIMAGTLIAKILYFPLKLLLLISKLGSKIPLGNINVISPNILTLIIYYFLIFIIPYIIIIYKSKNLSPTQRRIRNIYFLVKHILLKNKLIIKVLFVIIIVTLFFSLIYFLFFQNLKIYFIDVGQGDSTLIITPHNKKILIDGGGSENFDVGKNTLLPYLLSRKITKIDYMFISHTDEDHIRTDCFILCKK